MAEWKKTMLVELNNLETNRFGIIAARVIDVSASPEAIAAEAHAKGVQMLTIRVDVSDLPRVHALEAAGYQLMDTLVYYSRDLVDLPATRQSVNGVTLRQATPADTVSVGKLAREAFAGYIGHYHADPRLNDAAADAAYVEWAENSTERVSGDAPVLLAEVAGRVSGFLTMRRNSPDEMEIVLNAVGPESQGKGLYTALVSESLSIARELGAGAVIISTQINNYAVQRIWARLGFFHVRSLYTFHKWM